jgi:hypothetical protein
MINDPKDVKVDLAKLTKNKNSDKLCNTCIKEDVCSIKDELQEIIKKIGFIEQEHNISVDIDIKCSKWFGNMFTRPNI